MGMGKKLGAAGIARMIYTEARKPQNQEKMRAAVARVKRAKAERDAGRRHRP